MKYTKNILDDYIKNSNEDQFQAALAAVYARLWTHERVDLLNSISKKKLKSAHKK
jgi:hypothetical protein